MKLIPAGDAAGHTDYRALAERMGHDRLRQRITRQAGLWARESHQGEGIFILERVLPMDAIIRFSLKVFFLEGLGRRNFFDLQIVERELLIRNLPAPFDGFRLLHLADLHCDLEPKLMDVLIPKLDSVAYDAVVLTGDYHNKIATEHDLSLDLMGRLIPHLKPPRFGILGNHDFIEKVAFLEAAGLPILLNEAEPIERANARIWICGVDDPHFFETDDLARARQQVPQGEPAILLSHSPEPYREAAAEKYDAMLCGHTHGGQFCLPGGVPIYRNMRGPDFLIAGEWSYDGLCGYTSRGTGACSVAARFFCPPEITIHTLRPAS